MELLLILFVSLLMTLNTNPNGSDNHTPYCNNIEVDPVDDVVIQKLVRLFASDVGCRLKKKDCITKWNIQERTAKYSVAWEKQCGGPGIGDNGMGSTFVCESKMNGVCCWPLGYDIRRYGLCLEWRKPSNEPHIIPFPLTK